MDAIHWNEFEKYGCPHCGCEYGYASSFFGQQVPMTCGECGTEFMVLPEDMMVSTVGIGHGDGPICYPKVIPHPRMGTPKHPYVAPDVRPEGGGEYWAPRGIGYDLSGFVVSKEAGERVVDMFRKALGKEPKTWLDYRPNEPKWIQVKVQGSEAHLEKLYAMTKDTGIITQEIVNSVVFDDGGAS